MTPPTPVNFFLNTSIFFRVIFFPNFGKACIFPERNQYEGSLDSENEAYDRNEIVVVKKKKHVSD